MLKNLAEGYRPQVDWGGSSGDAALVVGGQQVRVPAWRQKLLYALLGLLTLLAIANFLTTLWLLSKISFTTEGLGSLHVEVGGLQLWGRSWLQNTTNTADLRSRADRSLLLLGYHNTSLYGLDSEGAPTTAMVLDTEDAHVFSETFIVTDEAGEEVFAADAGGSRTAADVLTMTDPEGAVLAGSSQTPLLLARPNHQLSLESPTRGVSLSASRVMSLEARDGDIRATCLRNIRFRTRQGGIRFLTPSIYMPDLPLHGEDHPTEPPPTQEPVEDGAATTPEPETQIPRPSYLKSNEPTTPTPAVGARNGGHNRAIQVYQVCVCPSGRLFVAPAESICVPDSNSCR